MTDTFTSIIADRRFTATVVDNNDPKIVTVRLDYGSHVVDATFNTHSIDIRQIAGMFRNVAGSLDRISADRSNDAAAVTS